MAPEENDTLAVLSFRMASVEESIRDMRLEMRGGFAGLSFVGEKVYQSEMATVRDYAKGTREVAESARVIAMWALGVTVTAAIAALAGLIRLVAS